MGFSKTGWEDIDWTQDAQDADQGLAFQARVLAQNVLSEWPWLLKKFCVLWSYLVNAEINIKETADVIVKIILNQLQIKHNHKKWEYVDSKQHLVLCWNCCRHCHQAGSTSQLSSHLSEIARATDPLCSTLGLSCSRMLLKLLARRMDCHLTFTQRLNISDYGLRVHLPASFHITMFRHSSIPEISKIAKFCSTYTVASCLIWELPIVILNHFITKYICFPEQLEVI